MSASSPSDPPRWRCRCRERSRLGPRRVVGGRVGPRRPPPGGQRVELRRWQGVGVHEERRWVVPAGLAVVGLVVLANAAGKVGLGTPGDALVVTVSVAVYTIAAVVFLLWFTAPRPVTVALLLVMAIAATATHHGDPTGTGGIGLYLGVAFAPLRLPVRTAAVVAVVSVLLFDVQLLLEAADPGVFVLVVDGGAAFFFFLGVLLRREREQRLEVARLLAELQASREAEREAAALAERAPRP